MTRYIDVEDLKKRIDHFPSIRDKVRKELRYVRSADVVKVVRCKDCKHNPEVDEWGDICPFVDSDGHVTEFPNDDFFCKRGERRKDGKKK